MVRTRAALRDALLALIEQRPFDQITIRDITTQAGTAYATFFRHYETKAALLNDLAAGEMRDLFRLSLPFLRATEIRPAAIALCRHVDEHRKLWSALLTGGAAGAMREEFMRQAAEIPHMFSNQISWFPDDMRIIFGMFGTIEILAWWLKKGQDRSVEQVAEMLDRLVITPTVNPDTPTTRQSAAKRRRASPQES